MVPYLDPPAAIPLFDFRVRVFGLLLFASLLVTYAAILHRGRALSLTDPRSVSRFAQVLLIAALVGARGGNVLVNQGTWALRRPALLLSSDGSFSSVAGVASAAVAAGLYILVKRYDVRAWADVLAWAFPFGLLVGRAGCALMHDHPGRLSTSWLAVQFPGGARFDCGLLEWMTSPILVTLAVVFGRRRGPAGQLAGLVGAAYALIRFSLDFLRAADVPGADRRWLGLTFAQWVCLALFAGSVHFTVAALRQRHPSKP